MARDKTGKLVAETVRVTALRPETIEAMWDLFARYYADVERSTFDADLADKRDVILLYDAGDRSLQGFSTVVVYERELEGRRFVAIFSGDTVIEEAYWGQRALQFAFYRYLVRTKLRHPLRPVYWYLISKGYKTYLLLARNVPNHWPRHDRPTPAFEQRVLDHLGADRFGADYDAERGVLAHPVCVGRLKGWVAPIDAELLRYPDIRFFAERNPGYTRGDELCCIGKVDLGLVTGSLSRLVLKPGRRARRALRAQLSTS